MQSSLKKTHLAVGLIALVLFPLTGAYMRFYLAGDFEASDRVRFSTRAAHVYILLCAIIHLSLGSYLRITARRLFANLQAAGSLLLLASTALVIAAFFFEPKTSLDKPVTLLAMVAASAGIVLHAFVAFREGPE
jgi:hypothetical protein